MSDPLDDLLDAYGAQLRSARPAPRRVPALATGVAAVLAAAVVVFVLLGTGTPGRRLDAVAQARAALSPDGVIIHITLTTTTRDSDGPQSHTTEQWVAADPPRDRLVQHITCPGQPGDHGERVGDAKGSYCGREEFDFGRGEQRDYIAQRDELQVTRGFDPRHGAAATLPSILGLPGADPASALRDALARRTAVDLGPGRVGGRPVERLRVTTHQSGGGGRVLLYDVDPTTFTPVAARIVTELAPIGPHGAARRIRFAVDVRVDAFDRIPLTASTASLLRIHTTPRTRVVVRELKDVQARLKRRLGHCRRRPGNRGLVCPTGHRAVPSRAPSRP